MLTLSPLLLLHIVNKHAELSLPLFVVGGGSAVPHLDPRFLRINLTLELTELELSWRSRKLECHLPLLGISTGRATESAMGHSEGPLNLSLGTDGRFRPL